jgi:multidrug efflux pump subunit AcrA (membrane-fusion protein)
VAPFVVLAVVATACTTGSSEDAEQVTAALAELNAALDEMNQQATDLAELVDEIASRVDRAEELTVSLELDVGRVGAGRSIFLPEPPPGLVTVQFLAEARDAAIPGKFVFYLAPEGTQTFDTVTLPEGETVETGPMLENGIAFVEPGVLYDLQVVYVNPTDEEIKFLVPGGTLDPQVALPFVRNRCWCAAIPFSAPPNGTFSRVITVGVGPDTPPGARAVMVWPVIRLES